jgi:type IV pilus assembly protein PilO
MNLSDLNNLDPNNIGNWPITAKSVLIGILCISILAAGYYLNTSDQLLTLEQARNKENTLKTTFETKQAKAANLDAYKQQMEEMKRSFGTLLMQLPSKTEVAALLVDISRVGIQSGLEFELFKPEAETPKEFYAEQPIKLRVTGKYHQFGNFVSGTAALPRIVTLHDFAISFKKKKENSDLVMEATAKTYRYLEEKEIQQQKKNKRTRRGKK